jgi:hypothetical protein
LALESILFTFGRGDDLTSFEKLDQRIARDPDAGFARCFASEIERDLDFAGLDQIDQVLAVNVEQLRELPDWKRFTGWQMLSHG